MFRPRKFNCATQQFRAFPHRDQSNSLLRGLRLEATSVIFHIDF